MKHLFLLRHAEAERSYTNDFDRPLTPNGNLKCQTIASYLKDYIQEVDLIISSPSKRTIDTIDTVLEELNAHKKERIIDSELYAADESVLLRYIQEIDYHFDSNIRGVIIVSHNPSVSIFAYNLNNMNNSEGLKLEEVLQPGSLLHFKIASDSWHNINHSQIMLENIWI